MKRVFCLIFLMCSLSVYPQADSNTYDVPETYTMQYSMADSFLQAGKVTQSIPLFRALMKGQDETHHVFFRADVMTGLGKSYEYAGKHDSAFAMYMESYRLVSTTRDTLRQARGARDMAQLLRVLNQFEKARPYCRMALDLIPGIDDPKIIANIYNEYAYLFELSGELDSAGYYYRKLIDISIQNEFREGESVGYSNLACVYDREGRYMEALELKKKGLDIDLASGNTYGIMTSYRAITDSWLLMKKYNEALSYLRMAEELCDTIWLMDLSGIEYGYYEAYKGMGSYAEALAHFEEYNRLHEQINIQESLNEVSELLTRFETEAKEQEITMLEQANRLQKQTIRGQRLLIALLLTGGLLIALLFWWWAHNKNEALKRMQTELHHFILSREKENGSLESSQAYEKWGLTERESEIIYYLGQGCSNAHIADKLHISLNTVKFHIKNIYLKLDVKNRIQALLRCSEINDH